MLATVFMIKIVIITPQWNNEISGCTEEQENKIHEWFTLNSFEIPFVPQVGMMIDLDDFFYCEDILDEIDVELGYVTVNQIVIGKHDIALHCV
jgi:hypothetical protein